MPQGHCGPGDGQDFKKAGHFLGEQIHQEILFHMCMKMYFKYIHSYIYMYIYIKEICEKQGMIQNLNQSVLRLRQALYWD